LGREGEVRFWWVTTHRTYLMIITTISLPRLP
jgi:hypothetical protein